MVRVSGVKARGVEVHQLLCGRDVAVGREAVFHMASQMANYIYVVIFESDGGTKRNAVIVDGCWDVDGILQLCQKTLNVDKVTAALYTHHHFDHTGGKLPRAMTGGKDVELQGLATFHSRGIEVAVGGDDLVTVAKQSGVAAEEIRSLKEGDVWPMGSDIGMRVLSTPGHTGGSVCFQLQEIAHADHSVLFTGDTLFIGSCGRYDLPDSNLHKMLASLDRLSKLPSDTLVLPGHNYAAPAHTTIGAEKDTNDMMLQAMDLAKSGRLTPSAAAASLPLPDYLGVARRVADLFRLHSTGHEGEHVPLESAQCCTQNCLASTFFEDMAPSVSKL